MHLRFDIDRAEFALRSEVANKITDARPLSQEWIGEFEDPLEIQVPGGKPQLAVEHRDPVAHIIKGDAQFGLALADLVEQPGVVYRNDRLSSKILQQCDLLLGKRADFVTEYRDEADQCAFLPERHPQHRARDAGVRHHPYGGGMVIPGLVPDIGDLDNGLAGDEPPQPRTGERRPPRLLQQFRHFWRNPAHGTQVKRFAVVGSDEAAIAAA